MKISMKVEHYPADSPGMWQESYLKLVIRAPKHKIEQLEQAINKVLATSDNRRLLVENQNDK